MSQKRVESPPEKRPSRRVVFRLLICLAVLAAGFVAMKTFSAMKKEPHAVLKTEHAIEVQVKKAVPETVQVTLTGYGVVEPVTSVTIASEVSGTIVRTHPDLFKGRIIQAGEILFEINPADYEATCRSVQASVFEKQGALERLKTESELDTRRMTTLQRTHDLAEAEYKRMKLLFEKSSVGNRSGVDQAEQAYNTAKDQLDKLNINLALYPVQIREAEARLRAADADLERARTNLFRCTVRAPFLCRVTDVSVEQGEYTVPGREILSLADDSIQEIQVSLDAGEAARWLRFQGQGPSDQGWFALPEASACEVFWSGAGTGTPWKGVVDRVVTFDRSSRTLIVAVRIDNRDLSLEERQQVPLVGGMFCTVRIPGRQLDGVYKVPRWAVTTDNTLYVSENSRLRTRAVTPAWSEDAFLYISEGINPGDLIITTRLVNPMENSLVTDVGQEG
ncbi:MAG: hypothetical protein V1793_03670 [Pseudomonadota bacterium]